MHVSSSYPLYCAEAYQRFRFYLPPYNGGYATPWLWYDGDPHGSYTYSQWESKIVTEMNRPAPFTCTMWGSYNQGTGNGTVFAKFRNDSTATLTGKIRFVLTEDSLYYSAPNGDLWHNHVARDYLPDTGGTQVTLAPGDSVTVSRNFTVQASWNASRCEIVTWIQSNTILPDSTRDIWQGGLIKISNLTQIEEDEQENLVITSIKPFPNPCVNHTTFSFKFDTGAHYRITIFDISGRKIRTISGIATGNEQNTQWDLKNNSGNRISAGVYFYRFEADQVNDTGKIVIR